MRAAFNPRVQRRLVSDLHIHRVDEKNRRTLARVAGAAEHRIPDKFARFDLQPLENRRFDRLFGMVEREFYFRESEHDARQYKERCGHHPV